MPVCTVRFFHSISRGSPTFTDNKRAILLDCNLNLRVERADPLLETLRLRRNHLWIVERMSQHGHALRYRKQMHGQATCFRALTHFSELLLHPSEAFRKQDPRVLGNRATMLV